MRLTILAAALFLAAGCALTAKVPKFDVSIIKSREEAIACAMAGGKAAFVADVNPETGDVITDWAAACIKKLK